MTASTTTPRLSKNVISQIRELNPNVAALLADSRMVGKKITLTNRPAGQKFYLAEGATLVFVTPEGRTLTAAMLSESTMGAASDGINYRVGQSTPSMPEGTWAIEEMLFMGKWFMTVTYVGQIALMAN